MDSPPAAPRKSRLLLRRRRRGTATANAQQGTARTDVSGQADVTGGVDAKTEILDLTSLTPDTKVPATNIVPDEQQPIAATAVNQQAETSNSGSKRLHRDDNSKANNIAYIPRRAILREVMDQLDLKVLETRTDLEGSDRHQGWMHVQLPKIYKKDPTQDTTIYGDPSGSITAAKENAAEAVLQYFCRSKAVKINDWNRSQLNKTDELLQGANFWADAFKDKIEDLRRAASSQSAAYTALVQTIADVCAEFSDVLPLRKVDDHQVDDAHAGTGFMYTGADTNAPQLHQLALALLDALSAGVVYQAKRGVQAISTHDHHTSVYPSTAPDNGSEASDRNRRAASVARQFCVAAYHNSHTEINSKVSFCSPEARPPPSSLPPCWCSILLHGNLHCILTQASAEALRMWVPMKMDTDFHMAEGEGETSYTNNSRLQRKALFETKPLLEKAVRDVYAAVLPKILVVSDLGCGSGENTLLFVSEVINAMRGLPSELQFFLNDLPGNDFNHIFRSLEQFKKRIATYDKEETLPPFYVAGLPGSYYARLFPSQSVHLFHSSYSFHWYSQPLGWLDGNERNIYIAKTTPPSVVKQYQDQFQKDFMLFLQLRHEELVFGGQMVLTFLVRKDADVYNGSLSYLFELLAQSLSSLYEKHSLQQGLVEEEKLNSFNLPIYEASIDEVKAVIKQSQLFDIDHIKLFESNWDPYDDSLDDVVQDSIESGVNVAKCMRAVVETLFASHFGESVLDALFEEYACMVAKHLECQKTKYSVIVLSLKKR
ncbi:hypothetical protein ACP70R_041516 [Stipagrostis hirtigluma subsp. patula]